MTRTALDRYKALVEDHDVYWQRMTPQERNTKVHQFGRALADMTDDEREEFETLWRATHGGQRSAPQRLHDMTVDLDRLWTVLPESERIQRIAALDRCWAEEMTEDQRRAFGVNRRGRP